MRRGPGGGENALIESISGSILHSHNFELGEEWYLNLELELTFNVVSVYNVPILIDDNCISSAYQIVLPETFFFTSSNKTLFVLHTLIFAQNTYKI